jgi:hypothetical protein
MPDDDEVLAPTDEVLVPTDERPADPAVEDDDVVDDVLLPTDERRVAPDDESHAAPG